MIVNVIMPAPIPLVIEYDSSIIVIVMNDGTAFLIFLKSTSQIFLIINTPTYIIADAAAACGINANNGSRNMDSKNFPTSREVVLN